MDPPGYRSYRRDRQEERRKQCKRRFRTEHLFARNRTDDACDARPPDDHDDWQQIRVGTLVAFFVGRRCGGRLDSRSIPHLESI
jgi:hypothetical protein